MSNYARRPRRIIAGMLAGALALSVTPILGFTGVASAADPLPPVADPIGEGNFCEGAPSTEPFTDVTSEDPSYEEIICLVATELTKGTTPTTYSPNGTITRRQMAAFIKRLIDLANELELVELQDLPAYDGTPDFDDVVDEDAEFQQAIGQLVQAGIVQGVTADEFKPALPVSRRQMAAFINRTQEFLSGEAFSDDGNYFDDDDDESQEVQDNFNALASVGIFQGNGQGSVFPGSALTRRQMANILLRHLQVNFAAGAISGAFETPAESLITVDPTGPAILPVSGTPGTASGELARRDYTITVDEAACEEIDVALIPYTNLTFNDDGTVTFRDVDAQANRADGLGGTAARIERVNGVNPFFPNTAVDGDDYVSGVDVPANRQVTVTVNSQTANQAVALVAFCDTDNNNQLNLDPVTDQSLETFGIGGVQLIVPAEAGDLETDEVEVFLALPIANLFTSGETPFPPNPSPERLFNYDDNDDFDYDSGPNAFNISLTEFETFLSGVSQGNISDSTLNSGRRQGGTVAGDQVFYAYRTDPAGESFFEIFDDVPGAVQNVAVAMNDVDSDGAAEVNVTWDALPNPDVQGYDVFAQQVINGIPTGDWIFVNDEMVTGTSFTGEIDGTPFESGDTWQFVVLGMNDESNSYGPDSNIVQVDIPAVTVTLPLVSELTEVLDLGSEGGELDDDDVLRIEFNQAIAVAANASIRVKDLQDGEFANVTCGTNALCQIGPNNTLTITMQADLDPAGGIGGDDALDHSEAVIETATGITAVNGGGAWHLPGSGVGNETDGAAETAFNADDLTRVFDEDNPIEDNNENLPDAIEDFDIDVQDDSAILTIDDDAEGDSDVEQGDTVQVYDAAGALVGSTTYDETVGAQINVGMLPAGTILIVQFIDDDGDGIGAGADIPSESTFVRVIGDAPVVDDVAMVDADTILVYWAFPDPPLTQVKPPSAYTVFNVDNTNLVATGDFVDLIDTDSDGLDDAALVDLDGNLTDGTDYVLRVQAATVENNNNVPNVAQAVPFNADESDLAPFIYFDGTEEAVTADPTPTFDGFLEIAIDRSVASATYEVRTDPGGVLVDSGNLTVGAQSDDFGDFVEHPWSATANLTGDPDGAYTITVQVTDNVGEQSMASVDFVLDQSAPVVTNVNVTDATDEDGTSNNVTYTLTEGSCPNGSGDCTVDITINGTGGPFVLANDVPTDAGGESIPVTLPDYINDQADLDITVTVTDLGGVSGAATGTDVIDVMDDDDPPVLLDIDQVSGTTINLDFDQVTSIDDATGVVIRSSDGTVVVATGTAAGAPGTTVLLTVAGDPLVAGVQYMVEFLANNDVTDQDAANNGSPAGLRGPFLS